MFLVLDFKISLWLWDVYKVIYKVVYKVNTQSVLVIIFYSSGTSMALQNLKETLLDEHDYLQPGDILNIVFVYEKLTLSMASW